MTAASISQRASSMYTRGMRRCSPVVLFFACLSLLGVQVSGLHVHAGAGGLDSALHGTHVHGVVAPDRSPSAAVEPAYHAGAHHGHEHAGGDYGHGHAGGHDSHGHAAGHHGHDHAGDRDVSIVELGSGLSKLLVILIGFGGGLIFVVQVAHGRQSVPLVTPPKSRRERWRPPLRAPPVPC
jgi:hypothetical protein